MKATASDGASVALDIAERARIWRVTIDSRFYGDYVKQDWAVEAALEEARRIRESGRAARVQILDSKTRDARVIDVQYAPT